MNEERESQEWDGVGWECDFVLREIEI